MGVKWVRLRYRSVNQHEDYRTLPMLATSEKDGYRAIVPSEHITPSWDLMYLIEVMDNRGKGGLGWGVQSRIARDLGVHRATVCRDIAAILYNHAPCPRCGIQCFLQSLTLQSGHQPALCLGLAPCSLGTKLINCRKCSKMVRRLSGPRAPTSFSALWIHVPALPK
jgi:hypothetical protein